jgi:S-(hydroxymethyl)glutathione dehydrogenase / alcohol dehydrogenase
MEVRGKRGPDPYLPHLLGHEGSGVVIEIGSGVSKVRPGDRVVLTWIKGKGADVSSSSYQCGAEKINAGGVTTFNECAVVSENRCVALPAGVPMDIAVLFGCAVPTGAGIVTNTIRPVVNSTLAFFGLGGIGMSALMACRLYRCAKVIAVDVSEAKLRLASEFGATHLLNSSDADPVQAIRAITGGVGVDYAIESAGLTMTIEQAFAAIRRGGGLCVFASHPEAGAQISLDPYELICGKHIIGTWGGASDPDRDIPKFAKLYTSGELPLERLLSRRYSLDEINDALNDLEHRRVTRPLIEIDSSLA